MLSVSYVFWLHTSGVRENERWRETEALHTLILHPLPIPMPPISCMPPMSPDEVAMGAMLLIVAVSIDMPVLVGIAMGMFMFAACPLWVEVVSVVVVVGDV
jgi:hypothetical protein